MDPTLASQAMEDDDPIKNLLQQTGWSYTEILKKLEAYKDQFPSSSKSGATDKELNKETDSKNVTTCNIELSVNETVNSCADVAKKDVNIENNIDDSKNTTTEKESGNRNKEDNSELTTNKTETAVLASNEINSAKVDDINEKSNNKVEEAGAEKQECKPLSDNEKEHIKLKEHIETTRECKNCEIENIETPPENEQSRDVNNKELQNIIERLEKFLEENSDNEECYAEKSESDNGEKIKHGNLKPEVNPCAITKTTETVVEQKSNLQESQETLQNVAKHTLESKNGDEDRLETNVENTLKIKEARTSKEVMKENMESNDNTEKIVESEMGKLTSTSIAMAENPEVNTIQNVQPETDVEEKSDSNNICNAKWETWEQHKLEEVVIQNSITNEKNNTIQESKYAESDMDADKHIRKILQNAMQCSKTEPEKEKFKYPADQHTELENQEKSDSHMDCNLESGTKSEESLENLESEEVNKLNIKQNTAIENKLENRAEESKEISNIRSKPEEGISVNDTKSEGKMDSNVEILADSKDYEEDKLENIIERLERTLEERTQSEDNEEENRENNTLQSKELKKINDEVRDTNEAILNLKEFTEMSYAEPVSQDVDNVTITTWETNFIPSANENISEDLVVEVDVTSPSSLYSKSETEKATSINLQRNLSNVRLRIIRKYKTILNRKIKKKSDNKPKLIQTEDIHSKLKEQLELLRTKRKTAESSLISSPPKPSGTLKFPQRNANRLNSITNTLLQKLGSSDVQMLSETINDSDSDLEAEDLDVNRQCESQNKKPVNKELGKSLEPEETVVLSNETDLIIVNVVGGYESPTHEAMFDDNIIDVEDNTLTATSEGNDYEGNPDADKEFMLNGIKPTKTTDVTKIKGWKNKKFVITCKEDHKKPSDKLLFQLMHDNSESSDQPNDSTNNDIINRESPVTLPLTEEPKDTNQAKSAFISDELDQYLTENSELNISYEVPKLEAEQTITTKYIDIKFPELPQQNAQLSHIKNRDSYKPKTLAEKRKMLAEADKPEIRDFLVGMNSKQRKDYEASVLCMRKKLIEEDIPFTRRCFMTSTSITNTHSFVVYNGKPLKVASTSEKEVIANIKGKRRTYKNSRPPCPKVHRQRKPSLLNDLKADVNIFAHDPNVWKTVQIKLPKLTLELKPQVGKRMHPQIEHLIKSEDFILTANKVEFALSALNVNSSIIKPQTFTFPLSYNNNQEYMTMRRRCSVIGMPMEVKKPTESDNEIKETVTDIVNKMLQYIEISEDTKDIIQDEVNPENEVKSDLPQSTEKIVDKNWRRRKRKVVYGEKGVHRTTLEMKRLSCKIVSISLDEESNENQSCTKEFCKLGCICKSIECNSRNLLVSHCGLSRCMFTCKCRYKNMGIGEKLSLPAGTDIFSEGIINRLQDEAKKNLAKVEKEFTQTVIKTNNQIIVVGDSNERRRRATKMPKKYIDFVEEDPNDKPVLKNITSESKYRSLAGRSPVERVPAECLPVHQSIVESLDDDVSIKTDETKKDTRCFVKLQRYDFTGIMPFCLVHSLYKCHCNNKAVFDSGVGDRNIVGCTYVNPQQPLPQIDTPVRNRLKPKTDRTFNKELYSSRTRGLATSYYLIRNKSLSHKCKIKKSSKRLQKELEMYLRNNATKIMRDAGEGSTEHFKAPDPPETTAKEQTPKEAKRQRKQSLIVLEDPGSKISKTSPDHTELQQPSGNEKERELKLQRRKTKSNLKINGQELVNTPKAIGESPGTILSGDTNNLKGEFLTLLGKKTSELRLLPWTTLATKYENGSFHVWYSNTPKICPLIITENGKRPTHYHCNIRLFEKMPHGSTMPSNIIRWLIAKQVPLEKSVDNILLVLCLNKFYWEICGLCEKNKTDSKTKEHVSISLIHKWNEPEMISDAATDIEPPTIHLDDAEEDKSLTESDQNVSEETEAMVHENLQENKKVMYCSRRRFQTKKLINDEIDDDSLIVRQVLWAPIPSVTIACKWRVIYMKLGFAYLSLSRSSYTIKYTDIMKAMKMAQTDKITVVLKSEEIQKNYPHRNFGIYCVHNYVDKLFVGPYFLNENHDLDTLSYVNKVLVNTTLLNHIKGKGVSSSGRWFHQGTQNNDTNVDDDVVIIQDPAPVVDLTCESDEESPNVCKDSSNLESSPSKNRSTLLKSMLLTPLINIPPEAEEEVAKAEKALDSLRKKKYIDVNKTLVRIENVKTADKLNTLPQRTSNSTSASSTVTSVTTESQDTNDMFESTEDDRLIIDEEKLITDEEASDNINLNKGVVGHDLKVNRYLVTNVPGLGYISAYQHESTKLVDVVCPITKKMKQFSTPEAAITALERVFTNKFIRVPTTFKLQFKMLDKLENVADVPLDRAILHGYHIVGVFGVRNLLHCTTTELENFGLEKHQITHMWTLFEKKLLWAPLCQLGKLLAIQPKENCLETTVDEILHKAIKEIRKLQTDSALFIKEKIDLESRKVTLAEKCSKLQYHLPQTQRQVAQQELDRIVGFSNRQTSLNVDKSKAKLSDVSEPIILDDDDDDDDDGDTFNHGRHTSTPVTGPMKFTLTKGPSYSSTSLLSGKKVGISSQINKRSLLTKQFQAASKKDNRFVVVHRKRNSSGNLIDLSRCTFQIKPTNTDEKMVVKEVPIKVRKEMLQAANNSALQAHQQKSLLLSNGNVGSVVRTYSANSTKKTFGSLSTITKVPKLNSTVISSSGNTSKFPLSNIAHSKTASVVSSVPVTMAPSTSNPSGNLVKTSSMATLTPMSKPPEFVLTNSTAKTTPNYIAIKEGNNLKYFQLVSETNSTVLQPVQTIKQSASSIKIQKPLRRIAPALSASLLTNQKTEK